jgi:predicted lipase
MIKKIIYLFMYSNIIFGFNINFFKKEIIQSVYLSKICYLYNKNNNIIKEYKCLNEYNKVFYITDKTNNYLSVITYNNDKINIAFRGTINKNNLMLNLYAKQENYLNKSIKIHSGYLNIYLNFKEKLIFIINNIIKNNNIKLFIITGHSLGGSIASLCTIDLFNYYNKNYTKNNYNFRCYTFGSPKIGNKNFANYYNSKIKYSYRFVNNNDLICVFPPTFFYSHIGHEISLNNNKTLNFIKQHEIDAYITNIKKMIY